MSFCKGLLQLFRNFLSTIDRQGWKEASCDQTDQEKGWPMLETKDLTPDQDWSNRGRGCSGKDCRIAQGSYQINRKSKERS